MRWVTWERIGVDRMACGWLIRRFIDPDAEFVFVPASAGPLPEGAEPFDIPGVRLSHRHGHCTFRTMVRDYQLPDPVLQRLAQIVDEADTVQEVSVEPAAPGLDLICRGLRRSSPTDEVALERGCLVYDALYAELASEPR
ncbi:MAG: chromate resistance protein [Chloroflexi bacterium]|nr:chromate resistance protein [Chloroflexota bacterium]